MGPGGAGTAGVGSAREAVSAAADALAAAGCHTPRLDAELLVAAALGTDRAALLVDPEQPIPPTAARLAAEHVRRRVAREPVAYILGRRGFRRIELMVDARVLVPRPETELLVEIAVETAPQGGWVHDVGTGSGAVALALADERPDLRVTASDSSPGAVEVARANAVRLGLAVEITRAPELPPDLVTAARGGDLDLVAANLPYVATGELAGLEPEIARHEPRAALIAGADGLDAIRALVKATPAGTRLALEHGPGQAEAVRSLVAGAETRRDLAGRERVTTGRAP